MLIVEPVEKLNDVEMPTTYVWQIERMQLGGDGGPVYVLREHDLIVSYQVIPLDRFPLEVHSIEVACAVPLGHYHDPLRVVPLIYDASGDVRYISNVEVVITPWGLNKIPLTEMYDVVREINAPVVLDWPDGWSPYGTGLYVGLEISGLEYDESMADQSPNLVCALDAIFPGFNLLRAGIPKVVVRRSLVVRDNWDPIDAQLLAFALLAEWEHAKYGPNEKTCQRKLVEAVHSVEEHTGTGVHHLPFQHGVKEGLDQ